MSRCSSCHEEVKWCRTEASGRMMPLDPDQVEGGNVIIVDRDGTTPIVRVLPHDSHRVGLAYVSHFSTCSAPERHRR